MIPYGSLVIYLTPKSKRYLKRLLPEEDWHSNDGVLAASSVAHSFYGDVIHTSMGVPIRILRPLLTDILMGIKRQTQIIYPKDIAQICIKLGVGPGQRVIEAGCGSGGLTLAFSWFCGESGRVFSHEARPEFAKLARRNLEWAGLGQNVIIYERDIEEGFCAGEADCLFLDVREPWLYLKHIPEAIKPGCMIGFLLPTTGQVSQLLAALEQGPFGEVEVTEILQRNWKPLPDRLRPQDRMAAHTSFLIFCRQQPRSPEFENYLPKGTRERKQHAAQNERAVRDI